jgi:hypothetical protein
LVVPTAVQIRTEIDNNSVKLEEIKTISISAKNNSVIGI